MSYQELTLPFDDTTLLEARIIRMLYSTTTHELELVVDIANPIIKRRVHSKGVRKWGEPAPPRDFRQLIFAGVQQILRNQTTINPRQKVTQLSSKATIEGGSIDQDGNGFNVELELDTSETYKFHSKEFRMLQRTGEAVALGNGTWDYKDSITGEQFSFYEPFPLPFAL